MNVNDLDLNLEITRVRDRDHAGGTWVSGRIEGFRFDALVFAEHADNPEYEIGQSRISKLSVQRLSDRKTVFNWDRGMDVNAADGSVEQAVVGFLCDGLAEFVFGK